MSGGVLKGLEAQGVILREVVARDAPYPRLDPDAPGRPLSADQAAAAARLRATVAAGGYSTTLLKGVTGSGKTEVYLEAVAETLRAGRQALVLLPDLDFGGRGTIALWDALAGLGGLLVAGAGLIVQSWCRIVEDDDEGEDGEQRRSRPSA